MSKPIFDPETGQVIGWDNTAIDINANEGDDSAFRSEYLKNSINEFKEASGEEYIPTAQLIEEAKAKEEAQEALNRGLATEPATGDFHGAASESEETENVERGPQSEKAVDPNADLKQIIQGILGKKAEEYKDYDFEQDKGKESGFDTVGSLGAIFRALHNAKAKQSNYRTSKKLEVIPKHERERLQKLRTGDPAALLTRLKLLQAKKDLEKPDYIKTAKGDVLLQGKGGPKDLQLIHEGESEQNKHIDKKLAEDYTKQVEGMNKATAGINTVNNIIKKVEEYGKESDLGFGTGQTVTGQVMTKLGLDQEAQELRALFGDLFFQKIAKLQNEGLGAKGLDSDAEKEALKVTNPDMLLGGKVNLRRLFGSQALNMRSQLILKEKQDWVNSGKPLRTFRSKFMDPENIMVPVVSESGVMKFLPKEEVDAKFYKGSGKKRVPKKYGIYRTIDDYVNYMSDDKNKKTTIFGNVEREQRAKQAMIRTLMQNNPQLSEEEAINALAEKGYI